MKIFQFGFVVCCFGFLAGGLALVTGQALGLILQQGSFVSAASDLLNDAVCIACACAAGFGFVLPYLWTWPRRNLRPRPETHARRDRKIESRQTDELDFS